VAVYRRVLDEETKYLWETVESQKSLGRYTIEVPGGHGRKARQARMEIRICPAHHATRALVVFAYLRVPAGVVWFWNWLS